MPWVLRLNESCRLTVKPLCPTMRSNRKHLAFCSHMLQFNSFTRSTHPNGMFSKCISNAQSVSGHVLISVFFNNFDQTLCCSTRSIFFWLWCASTTSISQPAGKHFQGCIDEFQQHWNAHTEIWDHSHRCLLSVGFQLTPR